MSGIIFWIKKNIITIIQSIYKKIMGNQKCIAGRPSFNINLIIIIIEIKSVFVGIGYPCNFQFSYKHELLIFSRIMSP